MLRKKLHNIIIQKQIFFRRFTNPNEGNGQPPYENNKGGFCCASESKYAEFNPGRSTITSNN